MTYSTVATGATPELVVYLIDISGSMSQQVDGAPKIEHVNAAVKSVIQRMIKRSTKGRIIAPRYRLCIGCYSDTVTDILPGIRTIAEVATQGAPHLSTLATTDTAAAFRWARDILKAEIPKLDGCPAPMVCHLTDGEYTGADPEPVAAEIMAMSTADGNVLVENIYVGDHLTNHPITDPMKWEGINDESELASSPYVHKLFRMSSSLPQSYANVIREENYSMRAGARMLIPASNKALIELAFAMSGATPVVEKQTATTTA